jgi:hypothetical protein
MAPMPTGATYLTTMDPQIIAIQHVAEALINGDFCVEQQECFSQCPFSYCVIHHCST